jgi:regulator of protease activity HflC (stomatin/prohibitin superfamily)
MSIEVVLLGALGLAAVATLAATFFTVEQRTTAIVQRLGRFVRKVGPGLHAKIPFVERVIGRMNLRVQQLDVRIETKTADDVFVRLGICVQYYVLPERAHDAFYEFADTTRQISALVVDVVRALVPRIRLDDLFAKEGQIAEVVKGELAPVMGGFGYGVLRALVTDIDPDAKVKESMSEIRAAHRMMVAGTEKGQAERVLKAQTARAGAKAVMNLVLLLKDLGASLKTDAILIPHSPGQLAGLTDEVRTTMTDGHQTAQVSAAAGEARTGPRRPVIGIGERRGDGKARRGLRAPALIARARLDLSQGPGECGVSPRRLEAQS